MGRAGLIAGGLAGVAATWDGLEPDDAVMTGAVLGVRAGVLAAVISAVAGMLFTLGFPIASAGFGIPSSGGALSSFVQAMLSVVIGRVFVLLGVFVGGLAPAAVAATTRRPHGKRPSSGPSRSRAALQASAPPVWTPGDLRADRSSHASHRAAMRTMSASRSPCRHRRARLNRPSSTPFTTARSPPRTPGRIQSGGLLLG